MSVYLSTLKLHRYTLTIVSAAENYFVQGKVFEAITAVNISSYDIPFSRSLISNLLWYRIML